MLFSLKSLVVAVNILGVKHMRYEEFDQYKQITDPSHPFANCYETASGHRFYIEPGFYYALLGLKDKRPNDYSRIIEAITDLIEKTERLVFTGNYETPFLDIDGYEYREITDITDPLEIFVEDKSRGSDYGD